MRLGILLFVLAAASTAASPPTTTTVIRSGISLKATLAGRSFILNEVFLNGAGPFRMLLDTGNATSIVRPRVARRLNLKPSYALEQATAAQTRRVPVAILDEVRTEGVIDRSVEAIVGDVYQNGVDGVLGASWLVRHDYLLDYRNSRIVLDGPPEDSGTRVPLRCTDGRPVVVALIDGRTEEFVVDSGSSAVVVYEKLSAAGVMVQIDTNEGSTPAQKFTARLAFPGGRDYVMGAVRVDVHGLGPGLLPASAFGSVFVSNRQGYVEFRR